MNKHPLRVLLMGSCLAVSACATTTYAGPNSNQNQVGDAIQQPFRDISWMREEPPEILKLAVLDPYRLAGEVVCQELLEEIVVLEVLLGPDVDAYELEDDSGIDAGSLAVDAVASLVGLPFRGVFRWISGADQREKVLADAILSGVARRSFLKGAARMAGCTHAPNPEPELR
jgi:hypothetical protein